MNKSANYEIIENRIFVVRRQKVMIDRDLAELYGVETKYLNRQVRRNKDRFPDEFMFQLTPDEKKELVTICHRFKMLKHSSSAPYVFTEHGVAMLASVLKSETAIKISIMIVKAFIRLREILSTNKILVKKLNELENKVGKHEKEIGVIFEAIRKLMSPLADTTKQKIGFHP